MVNIELTSLQAEELKAFYVNELEKIQKRTDEILGLLNKLNSQPFKIVASAKNHVNKKSHKKIIVNNIEEIVLQKESEAKNPKWSEFIIQVLQEKQKPLSRKVISKLYEQHYNKKITNSKSAQSGLLQALYWLRVKNKKIQSIKKDGKKEKLYGLTEWSANPIKKTITTKISKTKKVNRKPATKQTVQSSEKNTHNWNKFIFDTLNKTKRVMSLKELLQYAIVTFNIPKQGMVSTRNSLSPMLSNLVRKSKTLKSVKKEGQTGRSYGISNWFDDDDNLIAIYK